HVAKQHLAALAQLRPGTVGTPFRPVQAGTAVGSCFDPHAEYPGRTRVLSEESSDATLDLAHRAMLPPTGGLNLPQARDDPGHEAFTHRLFLGSARGTPTQDEGLDAVAIRTTLDFQSFT